MDLFSEYGTILIILAGAFGFFMAWGVGANAMGTSVGSKALTIKQAILIAMVFEFAGAYLAGGEVTSTIRKGIVDSEIFTNSSRSFNKFNSLRLLAKKNSFLLNDRVVNSVVSVKRW